MKISSSQQEDKRISRQHYPNKDINYGCSINQTDYKVVLLSIMLASDKSKYDENGLDH